MKVLRPPKGHLYHGVYSSTDEDSSGPDNTWESLLQYRTAVSGQSLRNLAWVYVNGNWDTPCKPAFQVFPRETADWVWSWNGSNDHHAVPFIRMWLCSPELRRIESEETQEEKELRTQEKRGIKDPVFSLERIIGGEFDDKIEQWGVAARNFGQPLMVEWGGECNGWWMPWNGRQYGSDERGPELFKTAYQRIIGLMNEAGATNITWVFHISGEDNPLSDSDPWNAFEKYFPGNESIDWVGVSVYGPQNPDPLDDLISFSCLLEDYTDRNGCQAEGTLSRIRNMAPEKPIAVAEFGCAAAIPDIACPDPEADWRRYDQRAACWAHHALHDMFNRWGDTISAFSWWNEGWANPNSPSTDMRVQNLPILATSLKRSFDLYESQGVLLDTAQLGQLAGIRN
jgi:glycosyl hydrolase family 26